MPVALFASVFLIAACGLIYELIAGTLASYLLGDDVFQFSTIIGCYLFAMGIGSFLSRFIKRGLVARFVSIELMVGLIGGFSSSLLFVAFAYTEAFRLILYVVVIVVGTLVGLEIPLLMRILKERFKFSELISQVLTFDYLGALGASLLFPILLVPKLGLVRSALVFGILNAAVAFWSTFLFREQLGRSRALRAGCFVTLALLGAGTVFANRISSTADNALYADDVIFSRNTRYQHIVLTKWKDDLRLFLNTHLQFSSRDEYRYHEALVHPGLAALPGARRVLVMGGGDGLAIREILKYPSVENVTQVELDPEMTKLFSTNPALTALNQHALTEPRVHVINDDAFRWLGQNTESLRFHRGRFSRSNKLLDRQTLHHHVLPLSRQAPLSRRIDGGPKHIAVVCPPILLVHRRNGEAGRPARLSVPRVRSILRRMGLRHRQPSPVRATPSVTGRTCVFSPHAMWRKCLCFRTT